ncbi:MAG: thioredoxin [Alphaproteobacteria bacterium]|nr:thioredoxin [Alphaproteobacteria bacterium]
MSAVKTFTKQNFSAEVLQNAHPVLIDFWAEWCSPCLAIAPVIEKIAEEFAASVTVGKLNIDEHIEIPTEYGVRGIPTLMLFKNGEVCDTLVGAASHSAITEWLEMHV